VDGYPLYVWAVVLVGAVGIPAATVAALARGAVAARLGRRAVATVTAIAAVALAAWLVASFLLARAGVFQQHATRVDPWFAVTVVAVLAAVLLAARAPVVSRILADPGTPARLALPQTLRIAGGVFLVVMALGELPAVFAIPAGLGDIAVGVAAPFVARRLRRGSGRVGAVWFNVMGIVDLVVAVSIGFLAGLGPTNVLQVSPSTEAVTVLPLVLVPTVAVPLAVALHVISLRRLRATHRAATAASRPVLVTG
jgi:hypothetical protein